MVSRHIGDGCVQRNFERSVELCVGNIRTDGINSSLALPLLFFVILIVLFTFLPLTDAVSPSILEHVPQNPIAKIGDLDSFPDILIRASHQEDVLAKMPIGKPIEQV